MSISLESYEVFLDVLNRHIQNAELPVDTILVGYASPEGLELYHDYVPLNSVESWLNDLEEIIARLESTGGQQ